MARVSRAKAIGVGESWKQLPVGKCVKEKGVTTAAMWQTLSRETWHPRLNAVEEAGGFRFGAGYRVVLAFSRAYRRLLFALLLALAT